MGEEADQRPDRVAAAEAVAEPHGRAGEQVQRVPERRRLRRRADQQLPVDRARPGPRRAGRATERAAPARPAASGGPSTRAARSGRRCCGTRRRGPWRPGPRRSPRCCRPAAAPARSAAGSGWPSSHGSGPAAGSRSRCRPRRRARCGCGRSRTGAAHPDTADRACPRPAGSARPARGSPRRSQRTSPFMTASIAYHTPLAAGVGWCCREPTLAVRRHELADEASARRPADDHRPNQAADQCLPASSSR